MTVATAIRVFAFFAILSVSQARGDSLGEELANWLDERGQVYWGTPPQQCDDYTFARRVYLDVAGRVPSVSELHDFEELSDRRRSELVNQLMFGQGDRKEAYDRLRADHLAKSWRKVLLPKGVNSAQATATLEGWLRDRFSERTSFPEIARQLAIATEGSSSYFQILGSMPEAYAAHLSRSLLGVRIECAQCHDHPFASWKQKDFWGLAAYYGDIAPQVSKFPGAIEHEGVLYDAKVLWDETESVKNRRDFARWLVDAKNPQFAANIVNRTWQQMLGTGLYADVENLDRATAEERKFLDEVAGKFIESNYDLGYLMAGIMKSKWYQAVSSGSEPIGNQFARRLKVSTPEQVFDSLEQSLLLSRTRIDAKSPRWSGERTQFVVKLEETSVDDLRQYESGIPQSLMLMNGKITNDAIGDDESRLLRAVVEAPYLDKASRLEMLYLAVLTRQPSDSEKAALLEFLSERDESQLHRGYGEILWALINSPEFVLCR